MFPYGGDGAWRSLRVATKAEYPDTTTNIFVPSYHSRLHLVHDRSQRSYEHQKPQYEMGSPLPGVAALLSRSASSGKNQTMATDRNVHSRWQDEDATVSRKHEDEDEHRGRALTSTRTAASRSQSPSRTLSTRDRGIFSSADVPMRANRREWIERESPDRVTDAKPSSIVQQPSQEYHHELDHQHQIQRYLPDRGQRQHFDHQQQHNVNRDSHELDCSLLVEEQNLRKRSFPIEDAPGGHAHGSSPTLVTNPRPSFLRKAPSNGDQPRIPQPQTQIQPTLSSSLDQGTPLAVVAPAASAATVGKSSRYLREMDRRVILNRIARGEKQSALAKEFHVSRAAICNLNKHRDEVLSRKNENPLAKHPKKPRLAVKVVWPAPVQQVVVHGHSGHQQVNRSSSEPYTSNPKTMVSQSKSYTSSHQTQVRNSESPVITALSSSTSMTISRNDPPPHLHKLQSRSVALLLTMARAKNASLTDFRRYSDRLMRLVIEHAMALAPIKRLNQSASSGLQGGVAGYCSAHPPCGIAIHPSGLPMLDIFRSMEPAQPAGLVVVNPDKASGDIRKLSFSSQLLPQRLNNHSVFVFDVAIQDPQSLENLVETLRLLLRERDACEKQLWIVALSISLRSIARLQSQFPELQIATVSVTECAKAVVNDTRGSGSPHQSSAVSQKPSAPGQGDGDVTPRRNDATPSYLRSAEAVESP